MTLPTLLLLAAALQPGGAAEPTGEVIEPKEVWTGVLRDDSLRSLAPETGVVTDLKSFDAIWEAWRPGEERPEVDFGTSFVLIGTIDGPNRMFLRLVNDGNGNLTPVFGGTRIGGPGFGYLMAVLPREGVASVGGRPLDGASDPTPPGDPATPGRPVRPDRPPTPDRDRPSREFVRIAVRGTLETGIVAIGGETTGTVIRANGMTFELVLDEPNLRERAEGLNGRPAVVAGELTVRPGVETGSRFLIDVTRIDPAPERRRPMGR